MQCSHNKGVIGSVCSFTCNEEYDLIGSFHRKCLADSRWNGTDTDCIVKHCSQLQLSPNAILVQSCGTSINSSCLIHCKAGYFLDSGSSIYTQSCTMTNGLVHWTPPEVCKSKYNECTCNLYLLPRSLCL